MPLFHDEFAAGRLSYSKVREATRVADQVDEAVLLSLAKTCTASQFERTVRGFRRTGRSRVEQEKRRSARWFTADHGMVVLTARLPAEEGALLIAALKTAMDQLSADRAASGGPGCSGGPALAGRDLHSRCRSSRELRRCRRGRWPRRFWPTAVPTSPGRIVIWSSSTSMPATLLRRALSRATPKNRRPPTHPTPARCRPTAPARSSVSVGSRAARRHGSPATRWSSRWSGEPVARCWPMAGGGGSSPPTSAGCLMIRDGGCQFSGCDRTTHLEAHHVTPWAAGGKTDLGNLVLLCRLHHMAIHDVGFGIGKADGFAAARPEWVFTDPAGRRLDAPPAVSDPWYSSAFPLSRALDHITRWTDPDAEHIRPGWLGEPVHITDVVAVLQDNRREGPQAA